MRKIVLLGFLIFLNLPIICIGGRSPVHLYPQERLIGDVMPFYHNGEYHIFYLLNASGISNINWEHAVSIDLINWKHLPTAIKINTAEPTGPEGKCIFTGCVIEKDDIFHAWYTGWNPNNPAGREFMLHATSKDLIKWTKHPQDILIPDGIHYANHRARDFRDPQIFWDEKSREYLMLFLGNVPGVNGWRFGCMTSKDVKTWKQRPAIKHWLGDECPDYFKIGDVHYLLSNHKYAYSTNGIKGPYKNPKPTNILDSPHTKAGKRCFDGKRHIWFGGWAAGPTTIPRELYPGPKGVLYMKPVEEVLNIFTKTVIDLADNPVLTEAKNNWEFSNGILSGKSVQIGSQVQLAVPDDYMLHCLVKMDSNSRLEIGLREQQETGQAYWLIVDAKAKQLGVNGPGINFQRPILLDTDRPVKIQAFVLDGLIECFINDHFAQTCHADAFGKRGSKLGLNVISGSVEFLELKVKVYQDQAN